MAHARADITFENEGSIFIVRGRTDVGIDWIEENVDKGDNAGMVGFGLGARLVEARYVDPIIDGAGHDGLRFEVR